MWYDRMRKYIKEEQQKKLETVKKQLGSKKGIRTEEYVKARSADGVFWISFEDFVKHFSYVYGCKFFDGSWKKQVIRGSWSEGCDGGCSNFKRLHLNPHYVVNVLRDATKVFVMLVQEKACLADGMCWATCR